MKRPTEKEACMILENEWLWAFPIPEKLISDNGKQFVGIRFENLLTFYKIKHQRCLPYNPRGNAILERAHSTILNGLRILRSTPIKVALKLITSAHNATSLLF
ncbi:putative LTR transposable element [Pseudoloma neurophilia]|uniref:Putative LTR transposable element n=1 Tax=Pseudoloma neurophilia TaxID=146866 RepID=A0A0R0M0E5_9MICR|nr:putative LTR transposable element [Pseudoloma neurophilia]